jgi:hypothetical protein
MGQHRSSVRAPPLRPRRRGRTGMGGEGSSGSGPARRSLLPLSSADPGKDRPGGRVLRPLDLLNRGRPHGRRPRPAEVDVRKAWHKGKGCRVKRFANRDCEAGRRPSWPILWLPDATLFSGVRRTVIVMLRIRLCNRERGSCIRRSVPHSLVRRSICGQSRQVSLDVLGLHPVGEYDAEQQYGNEQHARQPSKNPGPRCEPG